MAEKPDIFSAPRERWILRSLSGKNVLDIGFIGKDGSLHRELRQRHPDKIFTGLDVSERVLDLKWPRTVRGTCFSLPFRERVFDAVLLGEVLEHHFNAFKILREAVRVLKKGGTVLITTPNPYEPFRWLRGWLFAGRLGGRKSVRYFLGDADHKVLWEPLSLVNMLETLGCEIAEVATAAHHVPLLGRVIRFFGNFNFNFFPFGRLGCYLCVAARKR